MLAGHDKVLSRPEPHLLGPLAHLGFWAHVDKAPYDQHQAAQAMRDLVLSGMESQTELPELPPLPDKPPPAVPTGRRGRRRRRQK